MSHDSLQEEHKLKKENIIKYGIITNSNNINIKEIFTSFFATLGPDKYKIKKDNHYEFIIQDFPELTISITFSPLKKIIENYSVFNFFMLFIDMHDSKIVKFLDQTIDALLSAGDNNYNKKFYVLGFYSNDQKAISYERATTIIEAKGIDYYFSEIKRGENMNKTFKKYIELIINDSNTIIVEKFLDQKHSELTLDNSESNSKCSLF